jgi:1-acyl-sn-glycerol-3-phosphate acyltransferase
MSLSPDAAASPGAPQPEAVRPLSGPALVVAALRSVLTYVAVSLYVLVVGPPGLLVAFLFRWVDLLFVLARGGARLGFALCGIRCHVEGADRLPRGRTVVFCANHVSNIDAPLLFIVLHPRLRMLFKSEFLKVPILGRAACMAGFIPVERHNPEQSQRAVDQAAAALARGESFLVFPEGTRSRTGEMLPFKKGGFIMAIKAQVPVVPVAIEGGRSAMAKGSGIIRPVFVRVHVGGWIDTTGMSFEDRDRLVATAREEIRRLLDKGPHDTENRGSRSQAAGRRP